MSNTLNVQIIVQSSLTLISKIYYLHNGSFDADFFPLDTFAFVKSSWVNFTGRFRFNRIDFRSVPI